MAAAIQHLKAGEYPPDTQAFVLISIAANSWMRVTARFGLADFRSEHFRDSDPQMALHRAMERALHLAAEGEVPVIYVEGCYSPENAN